MTKIEFNQSVTLTAEPLDRRGKAAKIQEGTAEFTVAATDADGNPVDVAYEVSPENELEVTITSGDTEFTALVTVRADGDPDADEEAPVVGTATVICDAPNVVAFELKAGDPVDVVEAAPVEPVAEDSGTV